MTAFVFHALYYHCHHAAAGASVLSLLGSVKVSHISGSNYPQIRSDQV